MSTAVGRVRIGSALSYSFDFIFFKRFLRVFRLLFPRWLSVTSCLCFFLLLLSLLEQYLIYNLGVLPSKLYKVLGDKDSGGFRSLAILAVILIICEAFIKSTMLYVSSVLYLTWRSSLTVALHQEYFQDVIYYRINVIDKTIDNPDQRITQDVDKLCNSFSLIIAPIIIWPFITSYYTYQASVGSGYIGPVSVIVFFLVATLINKFLMSPVISYVFQQERREGDFRFKHMQIRVNAESAAFYRSGVIEEKKTNQKLNDLIQVQHRLIRRQYALNFSIKSADYLGSILSYIAIAVPIFAGKYDSLSAPDLSALISKNAFVTIYLINCFTRLIDLASKVTDMAGTTHRVGELFEVIGQLRDEQSENYSFLKDADSSPPNASGMLPLSDLPRDYDNDNLLESAAGMPESCDHIDTVLKLSDVAYGPPKSSQTLCRNLSFQLESGVNVLVTGDSGCGKTSLIRVINQIWASSGTIERNIPHGPKGMFILPQKPYFTNGTLREQIVYPLRKEEAIMADDVIYRHLKTVGLMLLIERTGGLDVTVDWDWYDELSPGEMQRLAFVRLFYHKPKFAVLDESTSQIGLSLEGHLYKCCEELGITVMSIGHRDSVRSFHDMELHLDGKGGWSLSPIVRESIHASTC